MTMNIGVVVSRYNEDISWALGIKHKIYLYNKGPNNLPIASVCLENVGREAHTYLYHIVNKYDELDDYTVFLQGNPNDHGFYDTFGSIENFNDAFFTEGFDPFLRKSEQFQYFTCPGQECDLFETAKNHGIFMNIQPLYQFVQGAQFAVNKQNIRRRPKSIYEGLLRTLSASGVKSPLAHTMERMWKYLFYG